jgi:hypothetical protein
MKPNALFVRGTPRCRGACAAELALLVPFVYLPLVVGAIYIGWLATARERVHESNHYALWMPGEQTAADAQGEFFREFSGSVSRLDDLPDKEPDVPSADEIRKLFDEWRNGQIIFSTPASARVVFYLDGDVIRARTDVNPGDSGYRDHPEKQQVIDWRLIQPEANGGENIPERLTGLLKGYMHRCHAYTEYLHSWTLNREAWAPRPTEFDKEGNITVPGAGGTLSRWTDEGNSRRLRATGDPGTSPWNLYVPNPALADQWTAKSAVRFPGEDKTRMARDQSPPATKQRGLVISGIGPNDPSHELNSENYWRPDDPTQKGGTTP